MAKIKSTTRGELKTLALHLFAVGKNQAMVSNVNPEVLLHVVKQTVMKNGLKRKRGDELALIALHADFKGFDWTTCGAWEARTTT